MNNIGNQQFYIKIKIETHVIIIDIQIFLKKTKKDHLRKKVETDFKLLMWIMLDYIVKHFYRNLI